MVAAMARKTDRAGGTKKPLSSEDREIWENVARSIEPLPPEERIQAPERETAPDPAVAPAKQQQRKSIVAQDNLKSKPQARLPASPPSPAPGQIDRRAQQKINKGQTAIDSTLDLHGMTQEQAYARLSRHIEEASNAGQRCILVITGKGGGSGGETGVGTGVLRRNLPGWLANQALGGLVSAISTAGRTHGGDGAFYVRLRKQK